MISALAAVPVAAVAYPQNYPAIATCALITGAVSAAIDIDVVFWVAVKGVSIPSFRRFYNPIRIFTEFKLFMRTLTDTGVIRSAMASHITIFLVLPFVAYHFWPAYFLPISIAVVTHFLSDIPNIRLALKFR
jgi:hypothetical protein